MGSKFKSREQVSNRVKSIERHMGERAKRLLCYTDRISSSGGECANERSRFERL